MDMLNHCACVVFISDQFLPLGDVVTRAEQ